MEYKNIHSRKMKPQLPNIITIGAMKAGTTSLHHYLNMHPDIYMSEIKEPNFFVEKDNWNKGIDWYKNLFITDKQFRGESSQGYTKCHTEKGVPELIFKTIPDVKLIYIIRDPIDRMQSHIVEYLSEAGDVNLDLNNAIRKNIDNHAVKTSLYYMQISAFLKFFTFEQIHVLTLEDLRQNRLEEMNKIFDFIGAKRLNDNTIFDFVKNQSAGKTMDSKLLKKIKKSKLKTVIKKIIPSKIFNLIKTNQVITKTLTKEIIKEKLSPDVEQLLKDYFREDIRKLKELTGKKFENWRSY